MPTRLRALGVCSGIGGFDIAAHSIDIQQYAAHVGVGGFEIIGNIEANLYRRQILQNRFPGVPLHPDLRTFPAIPGSADVIWGGTPCQDFSCANTSGRGLEGDRSSLYWHYWRLIVGIRPQYCIWENVPNALSRGARSVVASLRLAGYCVDDPQIISAEECGAPHERQRLFIVAYARGALEGQTRKPATWSRQIGEILSRSCPDSISGRWQWQQTSSAQRDSNTRSLARTPSGGTDSPQPEGMDDGPPRRLDQPRYHGWWSLHQPSQFSAPAYSVKLRGKRVAAIGDAVTPQQALFPLARVLYLESLR